MPVVPGPPTRGKSSVPVRDHGEKLVCESVVGMRSDDAGPQQLIFYADVIPMEGRTVLNQPSTISYSPPHPSLRCTQKLHYLHPSARLPRRVKMLNERENLPNDPLVLLEKALVRSLETTCRLLADETATSFTGRLSEGYFEMIMARLHFPIDQYVRQILSTYARPDAGVDARKCAHDLKDCALNPEGAHANPALLCVISDGVAQIGRNLETRWKISDAEFCQRAQDLRIRDARETGHVDPVQFKTQLDRCGLLVDAAMHAKLLLVYGVASGPRAGCILYRQFLSDLRSAAARKYARAAAAAARALTEHHVVRSRPSSPDAFSGFSSSRTSPSPPPLHPPDAAAASIDRHAATAAKFANTHLPAPLPAHVRPPSQPHARRESPQPIQIWRKGARPTSKGSVTFYDSGGQVEPASPSAPGKSPLTSLGGSAISTPPDSPTTTATGPSRRAAPQARPTSAQLRQALSRLVAKASRGEREAPGEEEYMRERLQGLIENVDIVRRQLESIDIRRTHTVTRRAFVETLGPFASNLTHLDIEWLMTKFARGKDVLSMKDLFAWCTPKIHEDLPPRAMGRVETGSRHAAHLQGPFVISQHRDGLNGYQPAAARKTLRIPTAYEDRDQDGLSGFSPPASLSH